MIEIGKVLESELEAVAQLEAATFADAWSLKAVQDSFGQQYVTILVARDDSAVVGYLICYRMVNEGQIARIAVEADHRRQGIARALLQELFALGESLGLSEYSLEVREGNTAARTLYGSLSFVEEGRRKSFYENPVEDGLILWRR